MELYLYSGTYVLELKLLRLILISGLLINRILYTANWMLFICLVLINPSQNSEQEVY